MTALNIDYQKMTKINRRGFVVWLTGLSGSGKSTIANALEKILTAQKYPCCVLDGDKLRAGLSSDLGFHNRDRSENIRRTAEVAKLFLGHNFVVIVAFISPYKKDRDRAKKIVGRKQFIEVYCDAPLSVCEERDTKGLYQKARSGKIKEFTGVSDPYEAPAKPDLKIDTGSSSIKSCVKDIEDFLKKKKFIT